MGTNAPVADSAMPLSHELPSLGELQSLYDRHRYLDAWELCAERWTTATDLNALSIKQLIFAARLSVRLGGWRLSRRLFLHARKREPANPLVRYFTNHLKLPRELLLDELVAFEANPDLSADRADGCNDELRSNWLASHAYTWARLRNYGRANDLLRQAHALFPDSSWIYGIEADIHGFADDWPASLLAAERAWHLDSRSQWGASSLAAALTHLGQIQEAVRRLSIATEDTQSAQLVQTACWYQCAVADTLEGNERMEALSRARELALRIEPLAPLADREFKDALVRTWLDIAELAGDQVEIERWTRETRSPYHRQVLANLKQNPSGWRKRLPYRRTLQKHLECVPASVASALSATGADISVEELAADVTFGGTAEWAAADWLRGKGFHVRFFAATEDIAARLIRVGIGFVVSWDDDESGHAVAIVGIDEAAGIAFAHDPTSFRGTEYLLRVFDRNRSPLGMLGMAAVPPERARELDEILPAEAEVIEAAQAHQKALALYGPLASRPLAVEVMKRFPGHPGAQYLQAIQDQADGRMGSALSGFRELFNRYPNAPSVRVRLIYACRAMGDSAQLRQTLKTIVESGSIPGLESKSDWIRPHPRYVCEYADMLRMSAETSSNAVGLLRSVLNRNVTFASAWHILADLRWEQRDTRSALLAYSVASFLAPHDEHYAQAYVDFLIRCDRKDEGLQWLRHRAERMGKSAMGVSTWTTWIRVLEDQGNPEEAIAQCETALKQLGPVTEMLAFAVPFMARMGQWDRAERLLDTLSSGDSKGAFHEAAVSYCRMRGQTATALENAEAWVTAVPSSMQARSALLELVAVMDGQTAATVRAEEWMRGHPANEQFEQAFCQYAQNSYAWRKTRVLRMRVKRNREDGWAWRELLFRAIAVFESGDETRRNRLRPRIEEYLAEAGRLAHENPSTLRAHGLWREARGDWRGAVDRYLEAIRCEPDHFYAYRRAWECSARLSDQERRDLWTALEPIYLENPGHLPNAPEMAGLLAVRFGVRDAERIVAGWRVRRPDDPNVLEAAVDLLLDYGHGRSDAMRALDLLRSAIDRFPYHSGLAFSLAKGCRVTGDLEGSKQVLEGLVLRRPDNTSALTQLAWAQLREGNTSLALQTLELASRQMPQEFGPLDARAQILLESGRREEAQAVLADALKRLPNSVQMYERTIVLFAQCDQPGRAVDAARQGTRAFPNGAYLWLLLGKALGDAPQLAATGEVEECLRKSHRLNRGLYETVDLLAMLLVEQRQFGQATGLLLEVESRMPVPSAALGRLAWVKRQTGDKREAVTDLASAVRAMPWYAWGWNLLLTWLDEDKNWPLCKELLEIAPPPMLTDVSFRQKRLLLLEKAKAAAYSLDSEWDELLHDFPEDIGLHLRRYDSLWDAKREDDASAVLRRVATIAGANVYWLARLVRTECREMKFAEALDHALTVCFVTSEQSPWPQNQVWDQMLSAGKAEEFSLRFRDRLQQGKQPAGHALVRCAEYILRDNDGSSLPKWLRTTRLNRTTRRIATLLRTVEESNWIGQVNIAELLSVLIQQGYLRLALSTWNRARSNSLEQGSDEWAQAGRAMLNLGKKRAARHLMQDWRTRTGVKMWMLANYLLCIPRLRKDDLNEAIATCRDALAGLPHDHCARYLAYIEAEACALAGDKMGLIDAWEKYARHFEGMPAKEEFFPNSQRYLIHEIAPAVRLVQQHNDGGYARARWKLRLKRFQTQQFRTKVTRRYLLILLRVMLALWLAGMSLAPLFK